MIIFKKKNFLDNKVRNILISFRREEEREREREREREKRNIHYYVLKTFCC